MCMLRRLLSHVWLFVAHQAPLSMGFSRQEYWSGLPLPLAGNLPDPGIEPESAAAPALAVAAKPLQSCLTLCDPRDGSPPGSPVPGILQARTLEWVAITFSNACKWNVIVKSLSRVWLLATPWTAAHQAPPSMGFSRQEYWSGVPWPSPQPTDWTWVCCSSSTGRGSLYHWATWEAQQLGDWDWHIHTAIYKIGN